jgi:hypothetical protein
MKTYNWTKAQAVVDEYMKALEAKHPLQLGRSWIEIAMARVGLVDDWRGWMFGESHAAWYACLIRTGNITRVTKMESSKQSNPSGTAKSIQKLRKGTLRGSPASRYLEEMLTQQA